jgi:hypothetical protein
MISSSDNTKKKKNKKLFWISSFSFFEKMTKQLCFDDGSKTS